MTLARRGTVRVRVATAMVALTVVAGCSAHHGGPPSDGTPRGSPATTADAACPAPSPVASATVPHALTARVGGGGWYGSGHLWTRGINVGVGRAGNGYRLKFGSFTLDDRGEMSGRMGRPRLTVHRVDGQGTGHGSVGGYASAAGRGGASISFWPTVVSLPRSGCWRITESLRRTKLRFYVHVPPPSAGTGSGRVSGVRR